MPRALPLPQLPPSDRVADVLRAITALTADLPADRDAAIERVSDCRHVMIAADAVWETALVHAREQVRSPGGIGYDVGGIKLLAERTDMTIATIQDRVADPDRPAEPGRHRLRSSARRIERARRERYPDSP